MNKLLLLKKYIETKYLRKYNSRDQLALDQKKRFGIFKKKVLSKSIFYQDYLDSNLEDFPIMNKSIMMDNFDIINTKSLKKEKCFDVAIQAENDRNFKPALNDITVGLSSGTSGNRGLFVASERERMVWAGIILAKMLPNSIFTKQKIALFLRANSNLYETVKSNHLSFEFYDLLKPFQELILKLNEQQPSIIIAPAQVLKLIAKEIELGNLNIKPIKVVSAAETLDDNDKKYIENVFKFNIDNIYQCTEGFIGTTCKYGTLHINEDFIILEKEWLDKEKTRFVPILTDLERETQPIVRYRLDDVLYENKYNCPCGSIFTGLYKVEGRCDDILKMKDIHGNIKNIFPDFIRNRLIINDETLIDYRIIQKDYSNIDVYIESFDFNESKSIVSNTLIKFFNEMNIESASINFIEGVEKTELHIKKQRIKRMFNE